MNARRLLPALLLAACSQDRVLEELTETPIGTTGGTVTSADGLVHLSVPPGAVAADVKITVAVDRSVLKPRLATPLYVFGPEGLTFARPVVASISVAGAREGRYAIANFDGDRPVIVEGAAFDARTQVATGMLRHFSGYGALMLADPCAGKSCGEGCTLCDPADPTCVNPPAPHACDPSGACVPALAGGALLCGGALDAGPAPDVVPAPLDVGPLADAMPPPDAGPAPDATPFVPDSGLLPAFDEVEPNDTSSTAQPLGIPLDSQVTIRAALAPRGDRDVFRLQIPPGVRVALHAVTYGVAGDPTSCGGLDTVLELRDAIGNLLIVNDDANLMCAQIGGPSGPRAPVLDPGTYFLTARHYAPSSTAPRYFLDVAYLTAGPSRLDAGTAPQPDGGTVFPDSGTSTSTSAPLFVDTEPNDTLATANLIPGFVEISGSLTVGDLDWFGFDVLPGGPTRLHAITHGVRGNPSACSNTDTVLTLFDAAGAQLAENDDNGTPCSELGSRLLLGAPVSLTPGRYYLRVRFYVPTSGLRDYFLDVTLY